MTLQNNENLHRLLFRGSSMSPLIPSSATHILVDFNKHQIRRVGDIFLYKDHEEWICHRFLGFAPSGLLFKGDFSTVMEIKKNSQGFAQVLGWADDHGEYIFKDSPKLMKGFVFLQKKSVFSKLATMRKMYRMGARIYVYCLKRFFIRKRNQ